MIVTPWRVLGGGESIPRSTGLLVVWRPQSKDSCFVWGSFITDHPPGPTKSPFTTCSARGVYYYFDPPRVPFYLPPSRNRAYFCPFRGQQYSCQMLKQFIVFCPWICVCKILYKNHFIWKTIFIAQHKPSSRQTILLVLHIIPDNKSTTLHIHVLHSNIHIIVHIIIQELFGPNILSRVSCCTLCTTYSDLQKKTRQLGHPRSPANRLRSEHHNFCFIYILDIDSYCPYLLSGETTCHLARGCIAYIDSHYPYLLFRETTSHLTSKWRDTFQYFVLMLKIAQNANEMRKNFFFFNVGNSIKREENMKYCKKNHKILFFQYLKNS